MDISSLRERESSSALSVTELNSYIKNVFENDRQLSSVTVRGEISNFTAHRSGHLYFSLKDSEGQIKAVMFRSSAVRLKFMPESGMKVIVHGSVQVYTRDGNYQIYVSSIQPDGMGALYLAYEQLKQRLASEGLFSDEHKKLLPRFPDRIGVITSPTGAAVRDIINVTGRRFPLATLYVYPALVQGEGAEESLINGVDYFDKSGLVDVVIIGRGGGSIEDLWAFNSEKLARRIYDSRIPVVSAVGHETDFTICDFVSDMRAPTPSAAAELVVPDIKDIALWLDEYYSRAEGALSRKARYAREALQMMKSTLLEKIPQRIFEKKASAVSDAYKDANSKMESILKDKRSALMLASEKCSAMNPLAVLSRGYSITQCEGTVITSVSDVCVNQNLDIVLSDGDISAKVIKIEKKA